MNRFAPTHIPVLRALAEVWGTNRFIVIGAAAVGYHIGMGWRGTLDLDLSVTAEIDKYTADLERLGWHRDQNAPPGRDRTRNPHSSRVVEVARGP